jgi:hypothetical protein
VLPSARREHLFRFAQFFRALLCLVDQTTAHKRRVSARAHVLLRQVAAFCVTERNPLPLARAQRGFLAVPAAEAAVAAVIGARVGDAALIDLVEPSVSGGSSMLARPNASLPRSRRRSWACATVIIAPPSTATATKVESVLRMSNSPSSS